MYLRTKEIKCSKKLMGSDANNQDVEGDPGSGLLIALWESLPHSLPGWSPVLSWTSQSLGAHVGEQLHLLRG